MLDQLVVATSTDPSDDKLADALESDAVIVRRGPLDDVAERFSRVISEFQPETIVRLTADCPLADPNVIDEVINEHLNSDADYSSNTIVRTYPQGLDVECVKNTAFGALMKIELTPSEREHVTLGIYKRPEMFSLRSVTQQTDHSTLRWTVDLPEDLAFVREIYDHLYAGNPNFGQDDILNFLAENPEFNRTN
jgi:spore coat polysaccharide biosynthesis protein SpsF